MSVKMKDRYGGKEGKAFAYVPSAPLQRAPLTQSPLRPPDTCSALVLPHAQYNPPLPQPHPPAPAQVTCSALALQDNTLLEAIDSLGTGILPSPVCCISNAPNADW